MKCEYCGKDISWPPAYSVHIKTCKNNPNRVKLNFKSNLDKVKNKIQPKIEGWVCIYCGQKFATRRLCIAHKKEMHMTAKRKAWNKGLSKNTCQILKKQGENYSNNIKNKKFSPTFLGKHHSDDTKRLLSLKEKEYISSSKSIPGRSHSIKACNFIDKLNIENGWHLQHAMNGGEFKVGRYHLDGYDKNLNIAFEYDEQRHNTQKEHDIKRQEFIKNKLHCRFIRYDEDKDLLYEV